MKVLLVAEKERTHDILSSHLRPRGFDFIHYRNPIKAMDNIDEIEPDIVVFSAEDFPRHWKPFLAFLRGAYEHHKISFVLLSGDEFPFEEASKANHLGVAGIVRESVDNRNELQKLEELVTRYSSMKEERQDLRYIPDSYDDLEFLITHPTKLRIITGVLFDLSPGGAAFVPDDPKISSDIPSGTTIPDCSLKLEQEYLSIQCKVIRNSERMALRFIDPPEELQSKIIDFIDKRAERELKMLLEDKS